MPWTISLPTITTTGTAISAPLFQAPVGGAIVYLSINTTADNPVFVTQLDTAPLSGAIIEDSRILRHFSPTSAIPIEAKFVLKSFGQLHALAKLSQVAGRLTIYTVR